MIQFVPGVRENIEREIKKATRRENAKEMDAESGRKAVFHPSPGRVIHDPEAYARVVANYMCPASGTVPQCTMAITVPLAGLYGPHCPARRTT